MSSRAARPGRVCVAFALAPLVLCACAGEPRSPWVDLAGVADVKAESSALPADGGARVELDGEQFWLVVELAREAWHAEAQPGRFRAVLPVLAVGSPAAGGAPYRLSSAGRELAYQADAEAFGREAGQFSTSSARGPTLELALEPGAAAPERVELRAVVHAESRVEGVRCVAGRRLSGAGFLVPQGRSLRVACRLPSESSLRFATAVEPLFGAKELRLAVHTFRVRLDGATLFEQRVEPDVLGEAIRWHEVVLPRGGVQKAALTFEVDGPLALTSFLGPSVGPSALGRYGARPWDAHEHPDLVVFLADTFRADNLTAYGSESGVTPEIDRFASAARVFRRAWSTSTHTLPAHSSMFSGVFPHQNGQVDYFNPLPSAVLTLAERLSAHGYRCGAVTDGVMVSRSHGLEQGFASFDERRETDTLARVRAFLDADDGRPIFLFVQSYAAHTPYTLRAETRARLAGSLRLERDYADVLRAAQAFEIGPEQPPSDPALAEIAGRLHDLYRGAACELDALFGRCRSEFDTRGLTRNGYLLFTSDHGEAFFEHGRPFHGDAVFEEELRVPLVLAGPGVTPGLEERPVSLIDFAPTLASLARLPSPPEWRGRSLLDPAAERVLFAFQSHHGSTPSTLAVIDGARKLIAYEDLEAVRAGKLHAAFDLALDPAERSSLLEREAWPTELARAQRALLEELLTPLVTQEVSNLSSEELANMRAMGYVGEDAEK
ncbi:MAG: hypothetical protein EXS08_09650 [Planctomycetes bacterium]|nr:hypothetical protein [Planctomycetota bacterium]